jgi:hypothetical protein
MWVTPLLALRRHLKNVKKVHEVTILTPLLDASVEYIRAPNLYGDRQVMAKMFNVSEKYLRADKCYRKTSNTHD